jgi:hypothetical protein
MQDQKIKGGAVDVDPRRQPGVPMEQAPHPQPGAQIPITRQRSDFPVFQHGGSQKMPPVYGTAIPPKGLSGVLRKWAYRYPDHWVRHWMMLLFADRVDVWEHRLRRGLPGGIAVASVLLLGRLILKPLRH